jgi:hypothetical protein
MKKLFMAMVIIGTFVLICLPAFAVTPLSLYEQENTAADGYSAINGQFSGHPGADSATNWNFQYGTETAWSGIYGSEPLGSFGWIYTTGTDGKIDVEADIEMFCSTTMKDNNVYFHIGKTAVVPSTLVSNNGQYVGIQFAAAKSVDMGTGIITDAMVGTEDVLGRDISAQKFNAKILLSWGAGYQPPGTSGDYNTSTNELFWLVNDGLPGSYNLLWQIELLPAANQPDGNYHLDPVVTVSPAL